MLSQKLLEMKRAMDEARKQYQGALVYVCQVHASRGLCVEQGIAADQLK